MVLGNEDYAMLGGMLSMLIAILPLGKYRNAVKLGKFPLKGRLNWAVIAMVTELLVVGLVLHPLFVWTNAPCIIAYCFNFLGSNLGFSIVMARVWHLHFRFQLTKAIRTGNIKSNWFI